ncbi:LysR family transcriptional regulator [Thiohalorhabdus denitrificans]|uniref:DNA-binding transcriptional regulator, LysR family n=1 Tax=Thiohalorhabdus denitrificans TaxID=381306 RepID=A0A0P9C2R3_9GAMM|nr:LysR family transcriptional regulator [Thiohalorhabdus denitrificans]KPV39248.1 LysR family transcriptional regulator [Thiohalorhabdus denitrificans]SCX74879.1 DNA-binding transcriptional regulator, LysR family [Thiohalorhabdus denitrificans]
MQSVGKDLARRVTLRQLKIFEALARNQSVTRAAEELYLTQPTASMQVKKLADAVGMALFEQVGRQVHLTEAGRELYETCIEVFGSLERLEMRVADMEGLKRGTLKVAVVTTAKYFAPHVLGHFKQRYPGIDVSLKVSNRERVLERLAINEDDLYIMGQKPLEGLEVEAVPIAPNPLVVMAPHGHALDGEQAIPLERLAEEPFIAREPGSGIREVTQRLFESAGLRPNVIMELSSNEAIKHAVASGLGLSVLSLHSLSLEGTEGPVTVLDVEGFPLDRYWYAVYPRGKKLSVIAESFLDFMVEDGARVARQMEDLLSSLPHASPDTAPRKPDLEGGR